MKQLVLCIAIACWPVYAAGVSAQGVPNFQKVSDQVYRGGQPLDQGFASLAALGVKTVVDLRLEDEHSHAHEQKVVESSGMRYISVPMHGSRSPSPVSVAKVVALLEDSSAGPVFVHCRRGADRTGAVIACYRIQHDGWDRKKAIDEANARGMSWFQIALRNYVKHFEVPARSANFSEPKITEAVRETGN